MAAIITSTNEKNTLTLFVEGKIDSSCAPDTEAQFKKICDGTTFDKVVLDAGKLEYISSAGLRVILRMRKDYPSFEVINVPSEVYEIFEMTGFTEMMTIRKAYKEVSIEGCEVIGEGANGMVYRLDPETVIKVYRNPDSLPDIQRETELSRNAFVAGIPTAIPYDIVRVNGSYGSVFELLNSRSFSKQIQADPSCAEKLADMSVELLKNIHSRSIKKDNIPDMRATVLGWVDFLKDYLPEDAYIKLRKLVFDVPESDYLVHGDYHIKNIMLQGDEPLLIDMDTLAHGNQIFEFASIYNAYVGFYEGVDVAPKGKFLGISAENCDMFWNKTVRGYFGTDDENKIKEVTDKSALIGFTRLMRRGIRRNMLDTETGRAHIEYLKNRILDILPRVDSIAF